MARLSEKEIERLAIIFEKLKKNKIFQKKWKTFQNVIDDYIGEIEKTKRRVLTKGE